MKKQGLQGKLVRERRRRVKKKGAGEDATPLRRINKEPQKGHNPL